MNLFEMLIFLLAFTLSVLFGKLFFDSIGWWGIPPAILSGFGSVWAVLLALDKLIGRRKRSDR